MQITKCDICKAVRQSGVFLLDLCSKGRVINKSTKYWDLCFKCANKVSIGLDIIKGKISRGQKKKK